VPRAPVVLLARFVSARTVVLTGVVAALMCVPSAAGQAGALDPTFSGDGKRVLRFDHGSATLRDVAIQSDGKLVAAGSRRGNFAVFRLLSNGSLDTTFSGDGKVVTRFPRRSSQAFAVAIQADGRIVVAGTVDPFGGNPSFGLVRYLPDGSLDLSFGGGDGRVRRGFSRFFDWCNAVAIQADGKIVAAGARSLGPGGAFAVMRFNTDGSLDTSFDGDGKQAVDLSTGLSEDLPDEAQGVVVQPDGKIVLGGTAMRGPPDFRRAFALARLKADGSRDSSFGSGGTVVSPLPSRDSEAWGLALGSDGKLVLAGDVGVFALTRFSSDGSLDTSFSGDGLVRTRFPDEFDAIAWDVEIQPDGRIVAVGSAGIDFAVARYNVDGTLDSSFSGDGRVTTSFNPRWGASIAFGATLQPGGKIVAVGEPDFRRLLLARYLGS
jgi:serralysin